MSKQHGRSLVHSWEEVLAKLVLRFVPPPHADGGGRLRAAGVLQIFVLAERLASLGHHKLPLRRAGVLCYEVEPFAGRPLPLEGEADVLPGEPLIVLHWQNHLGRSRLTRRAVGPRAAIFQVKDLVKADFAALAALSRSGAFPPEVRVVWAETILYPLLALYGFHTRPASPGLRASFLRIYFLGLFACFGLDGLTRVRGGRTGHYHLGEAWLSLEELRQRFPEPAASQRDRQRTALTPPQPQALDHDAGREAGPKSSRAGRKPPPERRPATAE